MKRHSVVLMGDTLNVGGTEGQFVEIARGLDRSRWKVEVACIRAEGALRARLEEVGVEPWSCGRTSFRSPRLAATVLRMTRRLRASRTDVVHAFDFYSNILAVPAARLARVPVIIASQRDLGELRPWPQRRLHSCILDLATHVLVNSEAVAHRLARTRAARSGRLSVIANGVDPGRFAPAADGRRSADAVVIGTLASLRGYKGLRELLEAAVRVRQREPRARFVIWGNGPLRAELDARIQSLGLEATVSLPGSTLEPEKALRSCDLVVHPSLSEASSNVVLEAMATGLPVVATRVGGTSALIEDGRSGLLVPPGDPEALARGIIQILDSPALAQQLARAARTRAVTEFGMNRMLERIEALYRGALGLGHIPVAELASRS
jgi:L-malate glycosyltransferase